MINEPTEHPDAPSSASPYLAAGIVAAGVALTAAPLELDAAPVPQPTAAELLALARLVEVVATVADLRERVRWSGVDLREMTIRYVGDLVVVELFAWSIHELSSWFDAYPASGLAVASLVAPEGARWRSLGGLAWRLVLGEVLPGVRLSIITETTEDEELPDTALVRVAGVTPVPARTLAVAA